MSCCSKLSNLRRGGHGNACIKSQSVRSTEPRAGAWCLKVGAVLWGWALSRGVCADSGQLGSELNWILGHPFRVGVTDSVGYFMREMASLVWCVMCLFFLSLETWPVVTYQVSVYHHKQERVWSWFSSIAQWVLNLSIFLKLFGLKICPIPVLLLITPSAPYWSET